MASLFSGTVTFLFTDIEGSTRLLQRLGDRRYAEVEQEHGRILRVAFEERSGQEVERRGDAFLVVFPQAKDAVAAAVAGQRALTKHPWPEGASLRVRMGLHTGVSVSSVGDYTGLDVHRASRICSAAHGGQILVSRALRDLVMPDPPPSVRFRDLGAYRLKDLSGPEQLFQVVHPDLTADFPSFKSLDGRPNNLPVPLTSFIGRVREIAEVQALIGAGRLVTLTGPGGAGKTRLALQVAAEAAEDHPDGVWLVEFAPIADPALVPQTVASTLSVREEPDHELITTLVDALRAKSLLLVLDNCEHLLPACADLAAALLRACPLMHILATSREALGVPGETIWQVPSLSLPDARRLPTAEDLILYEAVRLFLARAVATAPEFTVTSENARAVAEVCWRLDGLPLALELAAARMKALTAEQIAARLDDRFRLLTGGSRMVLPRHQTLQAVMDWSYDLLSPQEQAVLRRLSVFVGGWTLEAAEDVCAGDGVERDEVIDLLAQLVGKSLVVAETYSRHARYRMLETMRQYSWTRLEESGEVANTRSRHFDWYLALAEQLGPRLVQRGATAWQQRLDAERDNLRAALGWSLKENPEAGLRLWNAIRQYWLARLKEGRAWLANLLEQSGAISPLVQAKSLRDLAATAFQQGDLGQTIDLAEQALELSRELGDKVGIAESLYFLGISEKIAGRYDRAARLLEESENLNRETGTAVGTASALRHRGHTAALAGDYALATALLEQALPIYEEISDMRGVVSSLHYLGETKHYQGDAKQALSLLEQSVTLGRELALPDPFVYAAVACGNALRKSGDYVRAGSLYAESLTLASENGMKRAILECVRGLGHVAAFQNRPEQAARLLAAVESLIESMEFTLRPEEADHDRALATLRSALGEMPFSAAWSEGRALTMERAIEFALNAG